MRLALLLALAATLCLPASADDLLAALRGKTFDAPAMSFTTELIRDGFAAVARVDPSKPEGERFVITEPAATDWPEDFADFVEVSDQNTEGKVWCDQFLEAIPADAERVSEADGTVTYAFTPLPEEDADDTERKLFRKLSGTLVVLPDTMTISQYRLTLPEPAKPHFLAKVETFEMLAECAPAENGNSYFTRFEFQIDGSAMGQSFQQHETRVLRDLLPLDAG